jgi:hypothetical protein
VEFGEEERTGGDSQGGAGEVVVAEGRSIEEYAFLVLMSSQRC